MKYEHLKTLEERLLVMKIDLKNQITAHVSDYVDYCLGQAAAYVSVAGEDVRRRLQHIKQTTGVKG